MKEKNVKRANLLVKIIFVLLIVAALAIGGYVLYLVLGLHYEMEQVKVALTELCSKIYVWGTGAASAIVATISWATVKIASILDSTAKYKESVQNMNLQLDEVKKAFVETVGTINSKYSEKQSIFDEREVLMGEQINLLLDVVYDPEVREKIEAIQKQINELNVKADNITNEIKGTNESVGA